MRPDPHRGGPGSLRLLIALIALLLLGGCRQAIYTNLTEAEANDVLLTLIRGGIDADKRAVDGKTFEVRVPEASMANAIELLKADSQPARHYASLGDVFAERGLISSPTEERARYIYAIQQELSNTLAQIDGVLVARVHIVMPSSDPFAASVKPASASVLLKHRADVNMQILVPAVKDLVVRSVEGLTADTVSVSLFPARPVPIRNNTVALTQFFGVPVAVEAQRRLWILLGAPWVLVAALVVLLLHAARVRETLRQVVPGQVPSSRDDDGTSDLSLRPDARHAL
ncbi:MAG TPA: type III secretion inner membrane ring lipoprotein SctJ [Povalibacter sp.]|nr:type III secretion inner membrane ring lipoprotein SctJ [Povalibacter sp.]